MWMVLAWLLTLEAVFLVAFGPPIHERFRGWLEPVFQSGQTTIYRVPDNLARDAGAA